VKVGDYNIHLLPVYDGELYSWESQVQQYPRFGVPGRISYFAGVVDSQTTPVDCLLWRDENGLLRGILNHYPIDYPPFERAGNVNLWVDPEWQKRGIGTDLVKKCIELYGPLKVEQQKYSRDGAEFITKLITKGIVE
jgi:GNAT superfamily N-acetyltransferase